jgi:hypothetical protein
MMNITFKVQGLSTGRIDHVTVRANLVAESQEVALRMFKQMYGEEGIVLAHQTDHG